MNRTERLYAIVEELRAAGAAGRSSARLAARFEVSARTIKRDLAALQRSGVPIWAAEGRGGGYRLLRSQALPPLTFTAGEATAVAVALAAEPDLPFGSDGRSALTKILAAMPVVQREAAGDLAGRLWIRLPATAGRAPANRVLDEALRNRLVATIDYRDAAGAQTRRRQVEPLAFARTHGHWYLLAWCRRRGDGRWFRLDRVQRAHLTRETFPLRDLGAVFGLPPDDAQPVDLLA